MPVTQTPVNMEGPVCVQTMPLDMFVFVKVYLLEHDVKQLVEVRPLHYTYIHIQ